MLEAIAIISLILWALGLVSSCTMGGLVHILLAVAVVVVLNRVIRGRSIWLFESICVDDACRFMHK